jgi:probable DNA metabolism protein
MTIEFYRRNYIEGLFLSSGIIRSPDDTMEKLVQTARSLRQEGFNGYIHLKCVPYASRRLIQRAGLHADRLSVNIELPSERSLKRLTREKTFASVLKPMGVIRDTIAETREDRRRLHHVPSFAPAGQSTQLIVGASPETDYDILHLSDRLYRQNALKRVYYSAYVPVGATGNALPQLEEPPLVRENRLYQADWLIRLYGFSMGEVISPDAPFLDLKCDPKQAFALRHPEYFPVDVNAADLDAILKVPGIGLKSAHRIVGLRRKGRIRYEHLKQLGVVLSRAQDFITCDGLPSKCWNGFNLKGISGVHKTSMPSESPLAQTKDVRRVWVTDGTFDGLLTAIFEAYRAKNPPDTITPDSQNQLGLFERRWAIKTDPKKSNRVWKGLKARLGLKKRRQLFEAYLSGSTGVETAIYQTVFDMIRGKNNRGKVARLSAHIQVQKLAQKVRREAHRMKGLVRFQRVDTDQFLALIAPQYDIIPLIRWHFEQRFSDQKWIIHDTLRGYGLFFDRYKTREVCLDMKGFKEVCRGNGTDETWCQALWKRYYTAVNISQRNNPKSHLRQLPRRYWPYLTEKQP